MASTRRSGVLRLFVAVYPTRAAAEALLARAAARPLPPTRWVAPEQVHLTLQFIGDREPRELESITESIERSLAGVGRFEVVAERLVLLPRVGAARLVAAETNAPPGLLEVQRRLAHRLARNAREREGGVFLPHLTLARFRSPMPAPESRSFGEQAIEGVMFPVTEACLMASELSSAGATHREVARVGFGA